MLRKLMMLAAMLALVLAVVVPALAADGNNKHHKHHGGGGGGGGGEIGQEFDQQIDESGDVTLNTTVSGSGDNGNQCVAPLQFGNTGSNQNAQGFLQYASESGDIQFEGSSMTFAPELTNTCEQTVQQAAAAGGN